MTRAVAVDANLLLLFVVGSTSRDYIAKHKRLRDTYTTDDYDLLVEMIDRYSDMVLLPNALTELSNLLRHIDEPAKSKIAAQMKRLVEIAPETYIPSRMAVSRPEYARLGLTDAVLLERASREVDGPAPTLLTADLDLAIAAEKRGYSVENFNHYR